MAELFTHLMPESPLGPRSKSAPIFTHHRRFQLLTGLDTVRVTHHPHERARRYS